MITCTIGGVDTPLRFTLDAMDAIEQATGRFVGEITFSIRTQADRATLLQVLSALIAGAPRTPEDLRAVMTPGELLAAIYRVTDAINEGMAMETEQPDEDAEVDVVLEEIKKAGAPAD